MVCQVFDCIPLFIPAMNLNGVSTSSKLVMIVIFSMLGSMAHTFHDWNRNFGYNDYHDSDYLNLFWQDGNAISSSRNSLNQIATIGFDWPLNLE
jgi:hypothetical protein